jgi:uncharacterized protein
MKVHLRQIPDGGLHIEGDEDAKLLDFHDELTKPISPVHYSLDVGLSGGGLFATGTLGVDLQLVCARCGQKFVFPLRVENFAMQSDLTGAETVDLTPYVREDILLALPPYPHCDWNGEKVCQGAARNTTEDDVTSESHTWDELNKLKLK